MSKDREEHFIESVRLKNFRGFRKSGEIRLAPLTFLVGPNSSGKSSIVDALFLLAQSADLRRPTLIPAWEGSLIDLGSYQDAVYAHEASLPITINLSVKVSPDRQTFDYLGVFTGEHECFDCNYRFKSLKDFPEGVLSKLEIRDKKGGSSLEIRYIAQSRVWEASAFNSNRKLLARTDSKKLEEELKNSPFHDNLAEILLNKLGLGWGERAKTISPSVASFAKVCVFAESVWPRDLSLMERVSSGRPGPQRWFPKRAGARYMQNFSTEPQRYEEVVPEKLEVGRAQLPAYSGMDTQRVRSEFDLQTFEEWLNYLEVADSVEITDLSDYHASIKLRDNVTGVASHLIDFGYGVSQTIPVLQACLSPSNGTLVIEQPEIHLHPRAQGRLAEILLKTMRKRQIIVETHSVHFINKARIAVAKGDLSPEDVTVVYVQRNGEGSEIKQIGLDSNGEFDGKWPSGFFEERYEDSLQLIRAKKNRN